MLLEQTLSQRVAGITYEDLDDDLLHILKRNILDSYAGICASLKDKAMLRKFERLASGPASGSDIDVWGVQKRASVDDALFMNAILGRRSDLLNTYISPNGMGGGHPSDNVALVLTLADWLAMDGRDFLTSIYVAFYLSAAFSTYYDPETAKYDHDAAASFYTALTIGHAMRLSEDELTEAQRIAGMLGLDINQAAKGLLTEWKHCTYASSAMRGLQAVRMARAGFLGPSEIYEGEAGVNQFFPHVATLFDPPPDLKNIIFKRWPALVFCQTPIDVASDLSRRIPDPQTIASVDVKTYEVAFRNGAIPSEDQGG
jgi:2-methylcitrate dehydratase